MSHEIRTPMNSIVGLTHLCLQTEVSDRQREYLEKIQDAAGNLAGIINDVLDFSRVESGRVQLEATAFRLVDLLRKVSQKIALRTGKKDLEILYRVSPNVPEYLVGDSRRLTQMLVNLTSIFVRFIDQGEIITNVELQQSDGDEAHLHFFLQDIGGGADCGRVEHIGHFFSLPAGSLPLGTHADIGLSLALSHMLVLMMGGKVWMESGVQGENTFHVSLKLKIGETPSGVEVPKKLLKNMRTLVVDDNYSAQLILTEMLLSLGFRVDSAESGVTALGMLEEAARLNDPYALVLLDWKMPDMDGVETAKRIKVAPHLGSLPQMLLVSAADIEEYRNQGVDAGVNAFLIKPVTPSSLFDQIVRLLVDKDGHHFLHREFEGETSGGLAALDGARILLVEDNEINQQIAVELLQQVGAIVGTANNGKEALELLAREKFDAVLMDIQMPIMDGLEAARRARELPGMQSLPILAMTAHALASDRQKSFEAGMQDHLTKPIDPKLMYETLSKWVGSKGKNGEETASTPISRPAAAGSGEFPGLSVDSALKNLGGNKELYKKLLRRFMEGYENFPQQVEEALQANDRQLAVRLAHTVKGVAANLGAGSLAEISAVLEKTLAAEGDHCPPLAQAAEVLRLTLESIRAMVASSEEVAKPVAPQVQMSNEQKKEFIVFLKSVPENMSMDWAAVQGRLKDAEAMFSYEAAAPVYEALMRALDDFDVEQTAKEAEKLIELLSR